MDYSTTSASSRGPRPEAVAGEDRRRSAALVLGLDSLTALELKATIETELVTLSISRLVQGASLSELAAGVSESRSSTADLPARVIEHSPNGSDQPLSFGQQMLWYAHQFSRTPKAYNIGGAVRFRQPIDVDAFKDACRQIVARHESLRTVFTMVDDRPQARVIDEHSSRLAKRAGSSSRTWRVRTSRGWTGA